MGAVDAASEEAKAKALAEAEAAAGAKAKAEADAAAAAASAKPKGGKAAKDSVPRGTQDLFGPFLFKETAELVRLVRAGDCDGVLSELLSLERGHSRRDFVIEALLQRGALEPKAS